MRILSTVIRFATAASKNALSAMLASSLYATKCVVVLDGSEFSRLGERKFCLSIRSRFSFVFIAFTSGVCSRYLSGKPKCMGSSSSAVNVPGHAGNRQKSRHTSKPKTANLRLFFAMRGKNVKNSPIAAIHAVFMKTSAISSPIFQSVS